MITTEDILNMNFYKKEAFTGSFLGMRYRIAKEAVPLPAANTPAEGSGASDAPVEGSGASDASAQAVTTDCFRVFIWPGPYAFAATSESEKTSAVFPFTEEGRRQVVDWLNEQWAAKKDVWAATMLH